VVKDQLSLCVTDSPFYVWEEKLRRVKKSLKYWASIHKSLSQAHWEAWKNLGAHQSTMEDSLINIDSLAKEARLHHAFQTTYRQEEEYLRLKS